MPSRDWEQPDAMQNGRDKSPAAKQNARMMCSYFAAVGKGTGLSDSECR